MVLSMDKCELNSELKVACTYVFSSANIVNVKAMYSEEEGESTIHNALNESYNFVLPRNSLCLCKSVLVVKVEVVEMVLLTSSCL